MFVDVIVTVPDGVTDGDLLGVPDLDKVPDTVTVFDGELVGVEVKVDVVVVFDDSEGS